MPTLFDFSKKGRTAFSKAQNPGVGNLLRGLLNMKKHVKKRPLDPGAGDIPGFQKVCKLGKGLVLILAGENSSGKRVGHVQVCAQARFIFLKEAVTVQAVQVIFQKKGILTNGIVKQFLAGCRKKITGEICK